MTVDTVSGAQVLIVYHSVSGHTKRMAEAVAAGAGTVAGATAQLLSVEEVQRDDLLRCQALVLGSPVHQRSVSWQMKQFIDRLCEPCWFFDDLVGRVGGVFTTGGGHGGAGGGCELAQLTLLGNLASLGLLLVTHPKTTPGFDVAGMHWGPDIRTAGPKLEPIAPDDLDPQGLQAAHHHGAAIARAAVALQGADIMSRGNLTPPEAVREARRRNPPPPA